MKFIFLTLFLYISISAENLKDLQEDFEDSESLKEVEDFSTLSLSPSLLTREDEDTKIDPVEEDLYYRIFGSNSPEIIASSRSINWISLESLEKKIEVVQSIMENAVRDLTDLLNTNNLKEKIRETLSDCKVLHNEVANTLMFTC
ncbi:UNVERIFIED_CONTAM: hypothetical protein RMT77_003906 [Armadillidium vulgare]